LWHDVHDELHIHECFNLFQEESDFLELSLEYLHTARITLPLKRLDGLTHFAARYQLNQLCHELDDGLHISSKFVPLIPKKSVLLKEFETV